MAKIEKLIVASSNKIRRIFALNCTPDLWSLKLSGSFKKHDQNSLPEARTVSSIVNVFGSALRLKNVLMMPTMHHHSACAQ